MAKRILSLCITIAILLVSLPMIPLMGTVSAASPGPDISSDILAVDRVINNFNGVSTSGTAEIGGNTVNTGIGSNTVDYKTYDYSAVAGNTQNTLSIDNGVLKDTLTADGKFKFDTYISPVSLTRGNTMPSALTTALQFHVDFTGIKSVEAGSKVSFEVEIYLSTGKNSGAMAYSIPNKDFFYIPDATNENPNPEPQALTTGGGVQVYHGSVWGYAGQSGTIIMPLEVWDTTALAQFKGEKTIWDLYTCTQDYRHRSYLCFDAEAKAYAAGDVFAIDDICWMRKPTKSYDREIKVQDFSQITDSDLNGWGNGPDWSKGTNYSVTDGKFKLTKTCENSGRATSLFPIATWDYDYDALAFDFDASKMATEELLGAEKSNIRLAYVVNKTETTAYASSFFNGTLQFVWEDGTVIAGPAKGYGADIPYGFKGKIIVPASAFAFSDEVIAGIEAGGKCMFQVELMGLVAAQKGTSAYVDNFVYYDNADQLSDTAGTNFAELENSLYETTTPVTEDVRTVEAYFKTEASRSQSIIGTKFGSASYHGIFVEMGLISTGQPVFTIGSANTIIPNITLNDGKWHHMAMTADETAGEIRCYIDGTLAKTAPISGLTYPKYSDYLPLTVGTDMPAESMYYTVFDGSIANLRLWESVRTEEEINENKMSSVGANADGLVAEWLLNSDNFTAETNGKYPLKNFHWNIDATNELFAQYNRDAAEDEFTIIFLPDTQTIIKNFAGDDKTPSQVPEIFDWIIANAERLNVKAVVSLGDIIEYGTKEEDFVTLSAQYQRLYAAGIPAVATIGDHDYNSFETRDSTYYDKYFTKEMLFTNDEFTLGGYYSDDSIMNGYYYLTVENTKYLIMNLEVQPLDETLQWANDIVAANPDCHVIVATHRYVARPDCSYVEVGYKHGNSGEQMWEKFVSKHSNIDAVFCGHAESSGYYANYAEGENGNNVLQVNCDLQNTDQSYKTVAAILIGRFKKDGSAVSFNLYSAHHNLFIDSNGNDRSYNLDASIESAVASVDGVTYNSLSDALNNANGGTVKLLSNITVDSTINFAGDATIDLNGKTLNLATKDSYSLVVSGSLTVTGNGFVNVSELGFTTENNGIISVINANFNIDVTEYLADGCGIKKIGNVYTADYCQNIADADQNGNVSATDLVYFRNKILGSVSDSNYFDINGDSFFNAADIVRAKKVSTF